MTVASTLAQFFTDTSYGDLPALPVERARMVIASTLASAASGYDIPSASMIRALGRERAGTPEATLWFDAGPKLPVADAARVNAITSDAAASDDSDMRNIAHIGTQVTAVAFAIAERVGASGADVLAAMVLGYEAAGRIGEVITPGYGQRGFHGTIVTVFGGTVAASKLLGLSAAQMAQALCIASTSIGGLGVSTNSWAREYHAGNAATVAVQAALAAMKGYEVQEDLLEGSGGFFATFGARDLDEVTRDLGGEWDIATDMAIKLRPGSHTLHTAAEAAIEAARSGNVAPDDVESIVLSGQRFGHLWFHPTDLIGAAHSLPYFVAAGVVDKDFSWQHASRSKILDPVIGRLQDLVRVDESAFVPAEQPLWHRDRRSSVTIKTRSGQTYTATVSDPKGSAPRGIEWADVDAKYRALVPAKGLSTQRIDASLGVIHAFESVKSVSELTDLLS